MKTETYRSKVDWWLAAIIIATPLLTLAALIGVLISGDRLAQVILGITTLGTLALYFGVVWPVAYVLDERALVVRAGLLRNRIPYTALTSISATRNPLASPALSLHRLRIEHGQRQVVIISPAERADFVRAILAHAPNVTLDETLQHEIAA